jgi:hypothetical protein
MSKGQHIQTRRLEVEAQTLFEAVALAVRRFRSSNWDGHAPGPGCEFRVEVLPAPPIAYTVSLSKVEEFARHCTVRGAQDILRKERLRELLQLQAATRAKSTIPTHKNSVFLSSCALRTTQARPNTFAQTNCHLQFLLATRRRTILPRGRPFGHVRERLPIARNLAWAHSVSKQSRFRKRSLVH